MSARRRPLLAATLSFVVPGTGELYSGKLVRGLAIFALTQAAFAAFCLVAVLPRGGAGFTLMVGALVASLLVIAFSVVDAFVLARRAPTDGPLRMCQRPSAYLLLVVVGLAASAIGTTYVSNHVLHAYMIPTASMEPAVQRGDRLLANLVRFRLRPVERGDIVVFTAPDSGEEYVKRVIGLPGERIEIRNGEVRIDGVPLPGAQDDAGAWRETAGTHTYVVAPGGGRFDTELVPQDCFFLLGDNRTASKDSRSFGAVPRSRIRGSVEYLFWATGAHSRLGPLD